MAIKSGERMPAGTLKQMTKDGPKDVPTEELFKGKTVVLFSVPGAFTPTCDAKHLPGFVQRRPAPRQGRRHHRLHGRERRVRRERVGRSSGRGR
jgi:peroxiredoxin